MKTFLQFYKLIFLLTLSLLISCDNDDELPTNDDDAGGLEESFISFTVSGSENGERNGYADFLITESTGAGTPNSVQIYAADDLIDGVWTWQLSLRRTSFSEDALEITPGTCDIVSQASTGMNFNGDYINIETGVEYNSLSSGSITISSVTNDFVEGAFAFTVDEEFGGAGGQVAVTNGEFKAKIDS